MPLFIQQKLLLLVWSATYTALVNGLAPDMVLQGGQLEKITRIEPLGA